MGDYVAMKGMPPAPPEVLSVESSQLTAMPAPDATQFGKFDDQKVEH